MEFSLPKRNRSLSLRCDIVKLDGKPTSYDDEENGGCFVPVVVLSSDSGVTPDQRDTGDSERSW